MVSWRLDVSLLNALQKIKDRDGVPVNEQVRRALMTWVEKKGVKRADS